MQRRDARAYLWDARDAAEAIESFIAGKGYDDFAGDRLLRSAVERQFEIIGEALNQLARSDPETAAKISDLPRIVAFRNILIHGYAAIDHETVWRAVQDRLPKLRATLDALLGDNPPAG